WQRAVDWQPIALESGPAVVLCKSYAAVDGRGRRNRGPGLCGYVLASGRLAPFPKGAELGSRGKVQAGRRGRLIYQEPPPSGGGISGGNLETNGFKLRSGCSLEGCGEWNHESRSFKLPRKVHSSRAISERAALSA